MVWRHSASDRNLREGLDCEAHVLHVLPTSARFVPFYELWLILSAP
jgi:hypothetical protein